MTHISYDIDSGVHWPVTVGLRMRSGGVHLFLDKRLGALVQFLALHAAVLKPDFNLSLCEMELTADLPAFLTGDIGIIHELVLQDHRLIARVRLPLLPLLGLIWRKTGERRQLALCACGGQQKQITASV